MKWTLGLWMLVILSGLVLADPLNVDSSVLTATIDNCGINGCESGETCSSCPLDCGACPSGGGGGGNYHTKPKNLTNTTKVCVEDWICSGWSACADAKQTRTCADWYHCNTTKYKPTETRACTMPSPPETSSGGNITETVQEVVEEVKETVQETYVEFKETVNDIKEQAIIHWQLTLVLTLLFLSGCSVIYIAFRNGNHHEPNT